MKRARFRGETTTVELNALVVKLAKFYAVEHDLTLRRVMEDAAIEYVKTRTQVERLPYMAEMLGDLLKRVESRSRVAKA